MKKLIMSTGKNQGWILVNVTSDNKEALTLSGEIVHSSMPNGKFKYDVTKIATLLKEIVPDVIIVESDSLEVTESLLDTLKFYGALLDIKVLFFPVEFYYIYMGVRYNDLSLVELLSVGKNLFPDLLRELAYKSDYCIKPVLMNHCYKQYDKTI